ncbi:hypothetical protein EVAR_70830_1 [Eumeta japonica]|uniref:Uncharacterized protein n=1 Tax=Eumeta variegata TaxID=151549 RepID=A0A4C2ACN3_EUMVA|nr:hypothetical protein EVAR_70830_1 [Eumeta japonica]
MHVRGDYMIILDKVLHTSRFPITEVTIHLNGIPVPPPYPSAVSIFYTPSLTLWDASPPHNLPQWWVTDYTFPSKNLGYQGGQTPEKYLWAKAYVALAHLASAPRSSRSPNE